MVCMFLLYQMENNKNKIISNIYDNKYNDCEKSVREIYIRDKILQEILYLSNIENEKYQQIIKNKKINKILSDNFYEKIENNNSNTSSIKKNFEGVLIIENNKLFYEQKNAYWKYYDGYCLILVCSKYENGLLANNLLNIIIQMLCKNEILIESTELFSSILDTLMPNGQILFLTANAAQELIKQHIDC